MKTFHIVDYQVTEVTYEVTGNNADDAYVRWVDSIGDSKEIDRRIKNSAVLSIEEVTV